MMVKARIDPRRVLGRAPERLTVEELTALAGLFIALEVYTPDRVPLRTIEAVGYTAEECMSELEARGLDPRKFEYIMLKPPY